MKKKSFYVALIFVLSVILGAIIFLIGSLLERCNKEYDNSREVSSSNHKGREYISLSIGNNQ